MKTQQGGLLVGNGGADDELYSQCVLEPSHVNRALRYVQTRGNVLEYMCSCVRVIHIIPFNGTKRRGCCTMNNSKYRIIGLPRRIPLLVGVT